MPRSASGVFVAPPGTAGVATATIGSAAYNTFIADLEAALTDSLSRSGNGGATAHLSMGGFRLKDLAAPVDPTDAVRLTDLSGVTGFQPLDADLTALAALSASPGMLARTGPGAFAVRTVAVAGVGLSIADPTGAAGAPTITIDPTAVVGAGGGATAASQVEQEAATSLTTFASPGRQQFHPSAAKCWASVTVSAGTPTLAVSYNITSITDTATGQLTITIGTDFSTANWAAVVSFRLTTESTDQEIWIKTMAAGSILLDRWAGAGGGLVDPLEWYFVGFGDQ